VHKVSSQTWYAFLFLLLISNTRCKKSAPPPNILPPVTEEGKNTFGCKVNGEVWRPYANCGIFLGRCAELDFEVFHIDTLHKLPISFYLKTENNTDSSGFEMVTRGTNIMQTGNIIDSVELVFFKLGSQYYNHPPNHSSGIVNVTKLDTVNNIMAGTFSFILYNSNNDSVVVSDGRFDLTFNACLCRL
jgi:hypothetical protein